jgi:hypothetical protein
VRRLSTTYRAYRSGAAWAVSADTTWRDRAGDWDGDVQRVASGMTEADARVMADQLNAIPALFRVAA